MVVITAKIIYTLLMRANNKVGNKIAAKMINPPIVGVPTLAFSPAKPRSLISSATCNLLNFAIKFLP